MMKMKYLSNTITGTANLTKIPTLYIKYLITYTYIVVYLSCYADYHRIHIEIQKETSSTKTKNLSVAVIRLKYHNFYRKHIAK